MLIHRIGLVSRTKSVDFPAVVRVANALNLQIARDLAPVWQVAAVVEPVFGTDSLEPGVSPIYIVDESQTDLGFQASRHNQPYARIHAGSTWSLSASHEALEMIVDPSGNRLVAGPGTRVVGTETVDGASVVEYLVEICGPSMDPSCAYLIDGVLVADFCTPRYFDPTGSGGARYSFSGRITRPRQVLPNGRLTWFDPATGKLHRLQHMGAYEVVDLGAAAAPAALTGGLPLRAFADRLLKLQSALNALVPGDKAVQRRDARQEFLTKAGAAGHALFVQPVATTSAKAADTAPTTGSAAPTPGDGHARRATDIPSGPVDPTRPRTGERRKNNSYEMVRHTILVNAMSLTLPGILSVRPGLHLGPEGFTNERVIVVKALPDHLAALSEQIPRSYDQVRVEVRVADPLERLRARGGATYLQVASARHELRAPVFDDALYLDGSGTTVDDATVAAATLAGQVVKRRVPYAPPPNATLDAVTEPVTLVLHVSPDAGWGELSKFLSTNPGDLVVGMHDFSSGHVLQALRGATRGRKLKLTLDRPAPMSGSDQSGDDIQQTLTRDLGPNFAGAWALTNADVKSPVWIYPNAYHVKVAVRDDDRFWLSTGDWNNSHLPKIDLADAKEAAKIAASSDRDWHVVVVNKKLADTFRTFLAHDHAVALAEDGKPRAAGAAGAAAGTTTDALPQVQTKSFTTGRAPKTFFPPKTVTVVARVQPVLTPDNYQPAILALIDSATTSFYMQAQYIHPSGKPRDEDHDALIAAIGRRIAAGVDVRLIMSAYQTDDWMEKLVMQGIPSTVIRRQPGVHNNGIVVDHARVLISSQNWSADGTLRNRDAGLIIHDATAASYFEGVFLHDWDHLADAVTGGR